MPDTVRLRLPAGRPVRSASPAPATGPVVLFVPARDEGPRLGGVLERVPGIVCGHRVVTVVVDDGSTDDTVAVARSHGALVISHGANRGLGAAVRTGFEIAVALGAVAVGFCDGDGEYDPAELQCLVEPVVSGHADYVVGSRFVGEIEWMRPHRRVGNRALTHWVRWMVREPVTDGQSGFRVLSRRAASEVEIAHDYNYAQVLTIDLLARGFRYVEVPITYRFRRSGRSFVRLGRYLWRVVPTVHRQLAALSGPGGTTLASPHINPHIEPPLSPTSARNASINTGVAT